VRGLAHATKNCLLDLEKLEARWNQEGRGEVGVDTEALVDTLAEMESTLSRVLGRVEAVEQRLDRLEAAEHDRGFKPWFAVRAFDDEFRGTRNYVLDHYHDLADLLAATGGPVADLGCGRGELVELVMTRGIEVWGVEVSPELVDFCRSIYLDVRLGTAHSALEATDDSSLGGVALVQVVEHLTAQQLIDLLPLMARKVRPGGLVVAETVNATSPYVFTHSFYLDPTHSNPIHPSYLAFLFRHAGFSEVDIQWRSLVPESDRLALVTDETAPDLAKQVNGALETLNQMLFPAQDYAVVATR
jgi:O-antigen chain-terminating methyltransferase